MDFSVYSPAFVTVDFLVETQCLRTKLASMTQHDIFRRRTKTRSYI